MFFVCLMYSMDLDENIRCVEMTGIYKLKWILDLVILFCGWDLNCSETQGFGVWSWIRLDWIKGECCDLLHAMGCLFFLQQCGCSDPGGKRGILVLFMWKWGAADRSGRGGLHLDHILIQAADWSAPHSPTLSLTLDTSVCLAGDSSSYI